MECACGAAIEPWREQCQDCELIEVMGCSDDRRHEPKGGARSSGRTLRTRRKTQYGHDLQFYVLRWRKRGLVKIGATSDLESRIDAIQRQAGEPLELVTHGPLSMLGGETGFHAGMIGEPEKFSGDWYYWTPRLESLVHKLAAARIAA